MILQVGDSPNISTNAAHSHGLWKVSRGRITQGGKHCVRVLWHVESRDQTLAETLISGGFRETKTIKNIKLQALARMECSGMQRNPIAPAWWFSPAHTRWPSRTGSTGCKPRQGCLWPHPASWNSLMFKRPGFWSPYFLLLESLRRMWSINLSYVWQKTFQIVVWIG